jgi:6-phosphogluconolactonase
VNLIINYDQSEARLIEFACEQAMAAISHAWDEERDPNIVLTGGRTGAKIAKALDLQLARAISERIEKQNAIKPPKKLNIWLSDERFVKAGDQDRTGSVLLAEFVTAGDEINFQQVIGPMQSSLEGAAQEYEARLKSALNKNIGSGRFDAVILSMGEDGHVASCFPGDTQILASQDLTASIPNSPKPPKERVTLTLHALAQTTLVLVFALGSAKSAAISQTIAEDKTMPLELLRQNSTVGRISILTDQKLDKGVTHGI